MDIHGAPRRGKRSCRRRTDEDRPINVRERARRQSHRITSYITDRIDSGSWAPGDRLPTDRELAARFAISRNTVRRTLEQLEQEHRIVRQVGRGSFVAGTTSPATDRNPPGDTSPAELMELRLLVEPQMAELIVLRATARDVAALEECLHKSEAARSLHEFEKWDEALHYTLTRCTRNNGLIAIIDSINAQRNQPAWINLKKQTLTPGVRQTYQQQHRDIVDAVRQRDRELTRERMKAHLQEVRRHLLGDG